MNRKNLCVIFFANQSFYYGIELKQKTVSLLKLKSNIIDILVFDWLNMTLEIIPDRRSQYDKYIIPIDLTFDMEKNILCSTLY